MNFPKEFIFGAATAAYQSEGSTKVGGKGKTIWDSYLEKQGIFSPDPACDFYNQYEKDLENCRKFGLTALRVSIAWSRIFPNGYGEISKDGVTFYHQLFKKMKEYNIEAFVTLHHFDSPENLFNQGDWLNKKMIDYFVEYAKFCFEEYKDEVTYWITINEPTTLAKQQNITGSFPPNDKYNFKNCFQQQHNMNVAHAKVVNLFNEMNLPGEIGVVHAIQTVYPYTNTEKDLKAAHKQDVLENKFLLEGTLEGVYSEDSLKVMEEILLSNNQKMIDIYEEEKESLVKAASKVDFVGINYYYSKFVKSYDGPSEFIHNGSGKKGTSIRRLQGVGEEVFRKDLPSTEWDWPIYPKGLGDTIRRVAIDFPKVNKIYITENGLGLKESVNEDKEIIDDDRIDYLEKHLKVISETIDEGINVQGYFVWSLQDLFSWTNGYNKRYGLFYVDFETQERIPKKSAYWFKEMIEKNKGV